MLAKHCQWQAVRRKPQVATYILAADCTLHVCLEIAATGALAGLACLGVSILLAAVTGHFRLGIIASGPTKDEDEIGACQIPAGTVGYHGVLHKRLTLDLDCMAEALAPAFPAQDVLNDRSSPVSVCSSVYLEMGGKGLQSQFNLDSIGLKMHMFFKNGMLRSGGKPLGDLVPGHWTWS